LRAARRQRIKAARQSNSFRSLIHFSPAATLPARAPKFVKYSSSRFLRAHSLIACQLSMNVSAGVAAVEFPACIIISILVTTVEEQFVGIALSHAGDLSMIHLDGEIDIAVAAELKASLLKALESGSEISVSLQGVTALDLTAFQLLWSAQREARQKGLKFAVMRELSEHIQTSLECMGLEGLLVG